MSWNPGAGARKLKEVIDTLGYHVVAVQEAREDMLTQLSKTRWSYSIVYQQFIGARLPMQVETHCGEQNLGRMRWHFATVHFPEKRVGRDKLGILSIHLNNTIAKKPFAGAWELGATIDKARESTDTASVDLICGDLNMSRWQKNDDDAAAWHENTYNELEVRGFIPVADYMNECCFVAVHDRVLQTVHVKGSSWGEGAQKLQGQQREAFHAHFLQQVGAKLSSHDVHWPMSLAMRMPLTQRSSGLRQRSAEAIERRNERSGSEDMRRKSTPRPAAPRPAAGTTAGQPGAQVTAAPVAQLGPAAGTTGPVAQLGTQVTAAPVAQPGTQVTAAPAAGTTAAPAARGIGEFQFHPAASGTNGRSSG